MTPPRSARCPRVAALVQLCSSTPQNHRPGQLAAHIALGITCGGLVGGRGYRKGQLRVLGSPSALRTKKPRTGGPTGGQSIARNPTPKSQKDAAGGNAVDFIVPQIVDERMCIARWASKQLGTALWYVGGVQFVITAVEFAEIVGS
jgi:hypothetical protein